MIDTSEEAVATDLPTQGSVPDVRLPDALGVLLASEQGGGGLDQLVVVVGSTREVQLGDGAVEGLEIDVVSHDGRVEEPGGEGGVEDAEALCLGDVQPRDHEIGAGGSGGSGGSGKISIKNLFLFIVFLIVHLGIGFSLKSTICGGFCLCFSRIVRWLHIFLIEKLHFKGSRV